jgi:hypothetical protein
MALRHTLFVACMSMLIPATMTVVPTSSAQARPVADDRLRMILVNDASCLVEYNRPRVDAFLKMAPDTAGVEQEARLLGRNACMEGDLLSFEPNQLRGALFIALYQTQYGVGEPGLVEPSQDAAAWPRSPAVHFAALQDFAACAVHADPADARRIVLAAPDTRDENAAVDGIRPHLDGCFPKGGTITLNRMALSGILAEALYRLAPSSPLSGT